MADDMDDVGFWLPSDFLSDDILPGNDAADGVGLWFPSEFPYCGSDLGSPEESVLGSTEADSDEEELAVSGAARRSATKNNPMSSSPQSTLCTAGSDDGWNLISAAADEVMRMKLNQERGLLPPPKPSASTGYFNPALAQLHNAKSRGGRHGGGSKNSGNGRPMMRLPYPAWPPLPPPPQPTSSGMRAVFLGSSGTKREFAGTGVFLPRRPGTPSDHRRKPTCSTVLIPARVVEALNLDLDEAGVAWPRLPPNSNPRPPARGSTHVAMHPRSVAVRPSASMNPEYHLPQEWTY